MGLLTKLVLPLLPKQNKQKEASFGIVLRRWIEQNPFYTCSIETKDTRGKDYLSFKEVKDTQITYGLAVNSTHGVLTRVQGMNGEADYHYLREEPSFIAIKYPKVFCLITVKVFKAERDSNKKKSLTSARAKEIATYWVTRGTCL